VSVESIGRVTCICSDKTGTITLGSLQLTHRLPADGSTPESLLRAAALASRSETGDPIDAAILAAADGARDARGDALATFPFTEDRRRETAVVRRAESLLAVTKGAPEVVLGVCQLSPHERERWTALVSQLAADGHKVLACAALELAEATWAGGEPDRHLRFEGLLAFEDPVRDGVAASLRQCRAAGIRVVMVTGDHPATAAAVAREIGLCAGDTGVMTGDEVEALLARGDASALEGLDVVARAFPTQKLELVRALQAAGEIVAVTGDGVNDVPALQIADIGIAMGERGTRSAREAAAIVLLDDDFRTIVAAIAEGRQLFRNLQSSFRYLLTIHIPLVTTAALIPLAGHPLLYLPIHVVWLELIIHPSAMLAFQAPAPEGRLARLERTPRGGFFSLSEWTRIGAAGALLTLVLVAGYASNLTGGVEHARAGALVVLSTASGLVVASSSGLRTSVARVLSIAPVAIAAVAVQIPALAARLHLAPLHGADWALAALGATAACAPLVVPSWREEL
jgi:Ca2+-transporting ATPase